LIFFNHVLANSELYLPVPEINPEITDVTPSNNLQKKYYLSRPFLPSTISFLLVIAGDTKSYTYKSIAYVSIVLHED